ncbi:MAG: DUF2892 domain-containing protein [Egibacteraceae bacterium]
MGFARFMAGPLGRGLRIVAGIALVAIGLTTGGAGGIVLALVGLVPIYAGAANVCLIAPLLRAPFRGRDAQE